MVKVHVWLPNQTHVGHAALTVKDRYISFWPDGEAGKKDLKIKRSQPGMFLQSLNEDIQNEGNRRPVTIEVPGLDENKILSYLASWREACLGTSWREIIVPISSLERSWRELAANLPLFRMQGITAR